jgi:vacuolar transporter chaperone complex subunit 4
MAALYTVVAILCLGYSVGIYLYRSQAIRTRRVARYHDKWGPSVLCISLLVAVIANFALELKDRGMV